MYDVGCAVTFIPASAARAMSCRAAASSRRSFSKRVTVPSKSQPVASAVMRPGRPRPPPEDS